MDSLQQLNLALRLRDALSESLHSFLGSPLDTQEHTERTISRVDASTLICARILLPIPTLLDVENTNSTIFFF